MQPLTKIELSVLLFVEEGAWIAQGLQVDIAEQGSTIDEALENWLCALNEHFTSDLADGREPFSSVGRAPAKFWERYNTGKRLSDDKKPLNLPSSSGWMIPAIANELCAW